MKRLGQVKVVATLITLASLTVGGWMVVRRPHVAPLDGEIEEKPPEVWQGSAESSSARLAALPGSSWLAKQLGGDQVLNVLTKPDRGSAFRIGGIVRTPIRRASLYDIPVLAGPIDLAPDMLTRIAAALSNEGTYKRTGGEKGCTPEYGVRLRLERADDVVDVFLCYRCDQMRTVLNGKPLRLLEFDPGEVELIALAQALFTNDAAILELKPHVSRPDSRPRPSR
jgi:hypothetical protein